MNKFKSYLLIALLIAAPLALAQLGGGGLSGLPVHNHGSAGQGGATLAPTENLTVAKTTPILVLNDTSGIGQSVLRLSDNGTINWRFESRQDSADELILVNRAGTTQLSILQSAGATYTGNWTTTGNQALSGTFSSTKACATGYTRATPNLCLRDPGGAFITMTRDVCAAITSPSAGATALIIDGDVRVNSGNSVTIRFSAIATYTDSGCSTGLMGVAQLAIREFVAVASTNIGQHWSKATVPIANAFIIFTDGAENAGSAFYRIAGYFD